MTPSPENTVDSGKKRRRLIFILVPLFLIFIGIEGWLIFSKNAWSPSVPSTLVIAFLNLNLIFLILLAILVLRNVAKLAFERKSGVLGAALKTKLVAAFVAFSFIPTVILFILAWGSVSSTMNKWFSLQVETSLEEALDVAQSYYQSQTDLAVHYSRVIASKGLPDNPKVAALFYQKEYKTGAVWYFSNNGKELASNISKDLPEDLIERPDNDAIKRGTGEEFHLVIEAGKGELIRGFTPIRSGGSAAGVVVVDNYIPKRLVKKMREVSGSFEEFKRYKMFSAPIKLSYFLLFGMVALLIIFSATWFSFNLAKGITVPIQELAEGTRKVAQGDLDVHIDAIPDTELGLLVNSFNSMTRDLKESKIRLEEANVDLERRRQYIEIILGNVAAGVVSIDKTGRISTMNRSAENLLEVNASEIIGRNYRDILTHEQLELMRELIRDLNSSGEDTLQREVQLKLRGKTLTVMISITTLEDNEGNYIGMVIVFDDLTHLIKAQRMAAWREVARRIAHEIKNPLTPIQLSAERLQKKFGDKIGEGGEIFQECTRTIVRQVEELKVLVNEFHSFARMPAANPYPNDINEIIIESSSLFRAAHKGINFHIDTDGSLPFLNVDRDQIKRLLINLIDNSVSAVGENGDIWLKSSRDEHNSLAMIEVADNGIGVKDEDKSRLFEPYFSTKKGGTGLGLAIAATIISDHNGYIRVFDNIPKGTRFIIELPLSRK